MKTLSICATLGANFSTKIIISQTISSRIDELQRPNLTPEENSELLHLMDASLKTEKDVRIKRTHISSEEGSVIFIES